MKIGFFTDSYFPQINGVTYTIQLWKKELEMQGHEVFVYYPQSKEYKPRKNEIPLKSLPFWFYKGYKIGLPSQGRIEKDLDVIHIHGLFSMAAFGLAMGRKMDIPCILTYHTPADMYLRQLSSSETMQEVMRIGYSKYEKELLERCQLITVPSGVIKKMLKKKLKGKVGKIVVLSNGIDTGFFREMDPKRFRKKYGIPDGKMIGFTGRHSYEKHIEELIQLADRFDGTVAIAGDGPQREHFEGLAEGKKNIKFLGFLPREELPVFYSCLDILCFPSRVETQGLVVLEANACGTPVVGADALALKETIKNGTNGYKYEPGDVDELARKIGLVYDNIGKLRRSSLKHAHKESVGKSIEKLLKLYKKVEDEGLPVS